MIFLIVQKKWALEGNKNARRKYKNDLYEKQYKAYDNDDLRMANKPKDVSESDFKDLLKYWDSEKFKAEMEKLHTLKRKALSEPYLTANDERMDFFLEELKEGMHQRMVENLEQQKLTIHQEVTDDILG
ncbi:hypothetical protein H5410_016284 [Solanum commersonii]|uniref:Uncharacterized protein n=1 Tax=Solanum commersonii TaxID=4109 RepID=A0A9J5ZWW4_SOLCO|nr:hypothetical protein H5410_016284 [Solanum commersonii]